MYKRQPSEATLSVNSINLTPAKFTITIPAKKYSSKPAVPDVEKQIEVLIKSGNLGEDELDENTVEISTNSLPQLNGDNDAHLIAGKIVEVLNGEFEDDDVNIRFNINANLTDKDNGQLVKGLKAVKSGNKVIIKSIRNGSIDDDYGVSSDSNDLPAVDFSSGVDNLPGSSGTQSGEVTLPNGSVARRLGVPNFESFETRYSNARTPYFKSQNTFGRVYDLFKIHSLSDGEQDFSSLPVVTIKNISPAHHDYQINGVTRKYIDLDSYGTFDIEISGQNNSAPIEFTDISLNPSSKDFISKHTSYSISKIHPIKILVIK